MSEARERGRDETPFYRSVRGLSRAVARPMFRFSVSGVEHVPGRGPAIIIAPHRSWLDPVCIGAAAPRPVHFLIMDSVYRRPWARWFYRRMRAIPVAAGGAASFGALREALRRLEQGCLLGVFPQGRVVPLGVAGAVHPGAGLLAVRSGAPLIPATIRGSAAAWPHGRRFPGPARVRVDFGPPLAAPVRGRAAMADVLARIEDFLRDAPG